MTRNRDAGRSAEPSERGTDVLVGILLFLAILCAGGFAAVYATGGQVQLEGVLLAAACACIAIAIGMWAKHFMPQGPFYEQRPELQSSDEDRDDVADAFGRGERTVMSRRTLTALMVGAFGTLGAAALFPLRSLGNSPLKQFRETAWRSGTRLVDEDGNPIRFDALDVDSIVTVFPEGASEAAREDSQTVLLRVGPGVLNPLESRKNWSPDNHIAFSKVCTHAGCPVGLYQAETHQLVCPCHQSLFDVSAEAKPVFGPATRALPQLPLSVQDGYLVATDDFSEPVGPGFWSQDRG